MRKKDIIGERIGWVLIGVGIIFISFAIFTIASSFF